MSNNVLLVTPPKDGIVVPAGRILINEKWNGSILGHQVVKMAGGSYCDGMGIVDFYLTNHCPVVYITEADYFCSTFYKEKVAKLKSTCAGRGIVIAVMNDKTFTSFCELQDYVTLELDLDMLAIGDPTELPFALQIQATVEVKSPNNPFKSKSHEAAIVDTQISILMLIPNIGRKKAEQLLQHFGHITAISNAPKERLMSVVGETLAQNIYNYFHDSH